MNMYLVHRINLVALFLCFILLGCESSEDIYVVKGGEDAVDEMYSKSSLNRNFTEWCKHYDVSPFLKLPVKYPDNASQVLKRCVSYDSMGKKYILGHSGYGLEKFMDINNPTPEKWRHTLFRWEKDRPKRFQVKYKGKIITLGFGWNFLEEIYDTLPLDGTYHVYYFYTGKGPSAPLDPRHKQYLKVIVSPDSKIVAVSKPMEYSSRELELIRRLGVFVF